MRAVLRRGALAAAALVIAGGIGLYVVMAWANLGAPGHQWLGWP